MPVIIYMPKTNEFKKKFVLTYNLEYDTLHEVLESRIIIELFSDEVRAALNREAGERPALSRSCDAESPPTRHWETGKAGVDEDAEPEELPRWNAVSSLRETGRYDETSLRMPFCRKCNEVFLFSDKYCNDNAFLIGFSYDIRGNEMWMYAFGHCFHKCIAVFVTYV